MSRFALAIALTLLAGTSHSQVPNNCASLTAPEAVAVRPTVVAPIAWELDAPRHQLGAPTGVLSQAFDESMSVDQVLFRMKIAGCPNIAAVIPAPVPGTTPALGAALPVSASVIAPASTAMPTSTDPAAYKPRTPFDNAPWRFDMNQNGKRMTADEFTAWMKAKGVRVATGAPGAIAVPVAPVPDSVPMPESDVPASIPFPLPADAPRTLPPNEAGDQ